MYALLFQFFKFSRFQSIYLLGNPNYISTLKCFFDKFGIKLMRPGPVYVMMYCSILTVKADQAHPQDFIKSISHSHKKCQIEICIPVCVVRSEYFTRTSLYLVRLKIFEWIELL